jgi:DNA polymerase (family 10)
MTAHALDNTAIADALDRIAELLDASHDDPYRRRAYRRAAQTIRAWPTPVADVLEWSGREGLERIPYVGPRIAALIEEHLTTGSVQRLERLEDTVPVEDLFEALPGIGPRLARRLHDDLHVGSLEDLEVAVHDGRVAALPGFGDRRVRALQLELASVLGRGGRRRARLRRHREAPPPPTGQADGPPEVATVLAVDAAYRRLAEQDALPKVTPRRFNPTRERWLPVYHTEQDGWAFSAAWSNTAAAHKLGRTRDWVILHAERGDRTEHCTVVTERRGPLAGLRVIRGREAECARHYQVRLPTALRHGA